jgi:hypothetical protein
MNPNDFSRRLVLASCVASIVAYIFRGGCVYLVCVVHRQEPGALDTNHSAQMLYVRYHCGFLLIIIGQTISSLITSVCFGVLARADADWLVYTATSVVLWSMIGQVVVPQSMGFYLTDKTSAVGQVARGISRKSLSTQLECHASWCSASLSSSWALYWRENS